MNFYRLTQADSDFWSISSIEFISIVGPKKIGRKKWVRCRRKMLMEKNSHDTILNIIYQMSISERIVWIFQTLNVWNYSICKLNNSVQYQNSFNQNQSALLTQQQKMCGMLYKDCFLSYAADFSLLSDDRWWWHFRC